jgi:UDP-arabinose 4-epimerase
MSGETGSRFGGAWGRFMDIQDRQRRCNAARPLSSSRAAAIAADAVLCARNSRASACTRSGGLRSSAVLSLLGAWITPACRQSSAVLLRTCRSVVAHGGAPTSTLFDVGIELSPILNAEKAGTLKSEAFDGARRTFSTCRKERRSWCARHQVAMGIRRDTALVQADWLNIQAGTSCSCVADWRPAVGWAIFVRVDQNIWLMGIHDVLYPNCRQMEASSVNILVTGGAGYIGSHVCKALASEGYTPIAFDNLSRGNRWAVKWGPFEQGNIADVQRVGLILENYRPVALMHFSAYAYVGESMQDPLAYYENNFAGTCALMQAVLNFGSIPVVFSSTCATYGVPDYIPISEDHPQRPINPYGCSKLFVERMLQDLQASHGLRWMALRYFNAAGADPDGEIGEMHDPETHLIPLAIAAARKGGLIRVFGTDYDTPDGTCVRDYIHVGDIADAHVQALKHLLCGGDSCAINLANTQGYSVREVISMAEKISRKAISVELAARRSGDPPILIGESTRARSLLGWRPKRSELETQIRDAYNWIKKNDGDE